jgi:hypothetical protein
MLKRALVVFIGVAILGFAVSAMLEARQRDQERERKYLAEQKAYEARLEEFVESYDADDVWLEEVFRNKDMMSEVMTIELEPYWLGDRPILFNGKLIDVKTHDDSYYVVKLRQTTMQKIGFSMVADFGVDVLAEKSIVDKLLHDNPDIMSLFNLFTTLHAIVNIDRIRTVTEGDGGESTEVLVGEGVLLDMLYSRK